MCLQVDVAPEQQPAASSLASEASVQRLTELTQAKAAAELPASNTLCSRSSTVALASIAASSPSAFEGAASMAASEPAAADNATSGTPRHHMRWQLVTSLKHSACLLPLTAAHVPQTMPA